MFGGLPYIEMIKTIKEEIERRTGAYDICVKIVMYRTPREGDEVIDFYELKEKLGNVEAVSSYEKGVPIETRIGTLWGLGVCLMQTISYLRTMMIRARYT